jgi:predicted peptidase
MDRQMDENTGNYLVLKYSEKSKLNYIITLPKEYESSENSTWPIIIFLHSMVERGVNPQLLINSPSGEGNGIIPYALKNKDFPFITVSPLCPDGAYWPLISSNLNLLLEDITKTYKVNKQKIYLTGVSMGGMGVWSFSMQYPHWFAAIAPISGGIYTPPMSNNITVLKSTPIWAFHDKRDPDCPIGKEQGVIDRLKKINSNVKYTVSDNGLHYIHESIFDIGDLFAWFLTNTKDF